MNDITRTLDEYFQEAAMLVPKLGLALVVFLVFVWIAAVIANGFKKRIGSRMDDPLLVQFLGNVIRITFIIIAFLLCLKIIGLDGVATSIMAGAGVGAFVIGFAFKDIGENFLAGIMMAFKRPFRLNDTVELNGIKGKVVALNLRDTQLKTFDGRDVFIPNGAVVKNPVVNYTIDGFIRTDFVIGVDYDSNIPKVIELIEQTLAKIDALEQDNRSSSVMVDELASSSINLRVFYWMDTFNPKMPGTQLKNLIFDRVLNTLTDAGIRMPTDILELKNYKSESIRIASEGSTK